MKQISTTATVFVLAGSMAFMYMVIVLANVLTGGF